MKKIMILSVAVFAAMALSSPLFAAEEAGVQVQSEQIGAMHAGSSVTADEIKGMKVISQQGEKIGKIKEAKIDADSGEISYVILSKGGVLFGIAAESIAVPLEAFQFDTTAHQATLTVDKSKLDNAPKQAGMPDDQFARELNSHYGISPAWQEEQELELEPESEPSVELEQEPKQESAY